jgi:capsular polysaccharide transport system permease protein
MNELRRAWVVQKRVMGALFMREVQVRFGRRNLGFMWLFAEPLIFALPVLMMWHLLRPAYDRGMALMPFLWSGYLPLLLFRHVTGHALNCIHNNAAVLYHQSITPLDAAFAHCGLEALGLIAAMGFSFILFYAINIVPWPNDVTLFLAGILYMTWWALVVGLIVAAASERTHMIEHIWPPISYMYLPVCGFFYLADWLPTRVRDVALVIIPPLHAYEMIRGGMFGSIIRVYYDVPYLTFLLAALTLLALWLVRDVRRFIVVD